MQILGNFLFRVVFGVLVGAIYLIYLMPLSVPAHLSSQTMGIWGPLVLLTSVIWFYPIIAFHELGHVLGAKLANFRVISLTLWPFVATFQPTLSLRLKPKLKSTPHVLGFPTDDSNLGARYLLFIACGLLAYVTIAIGTGIAILLGPDLAFVPQLILRGAFISDIMMLMLTLYPAPGSDSAKILRLLFSRNSVPLLALWWISGQYMGGIRLRDWNATMLSKLAARAEQSDEEAYRCIVLYYNALDNKRFTLAGEFIESGLECASKTSKVISNVVYNEAAFYQAFVRGDAVTARTLQPKLSTPETYLTLRTKAAIVSADGDFVQAEAYAHEALQQLHENPAEGWVLTERELLSQFTPLSSAGQPS